MKKKRPKIELELLEKGPESSMMLVVGATIILAIIIGILLAVIECF